MRAICIFFSPLLKAKPNWLHCIGDANANAMRRTLFPSPAAATPSIGTAVVATTGAMFISTNDAIVDTSVVAHRRNGAFCAAVVLARGRRHVGRIVGGVTFATVAIQGATAWSSSFHADVTIIASFRLASDAQRIALSHTQMQRNRCA